MTCQSKQISNCPLLPGAALGSVAQSDFGDGGAQAGRHRIYWQPGWPAAALAARCQRASDSGNHCETQPASAKCLKDWFGTSVIHLLKIRGYKRFISNQWLTGFKAVFTFTRHRLKWQGAKSRFIFDGIFVVWIRRCYGPSRFSRNSMFLVTVFPPRPITHQACLTTTANVIPMAGFGLRCWPNDKD